MLSETSHARELSPGASTVFHGADVVWTKLFKAFVNHHLSGYTYALLPQLPRLFPCARRPVSTPRLSLRGMERHEHKGNQRTHRSSIPSWNY